MQAAGQFPDWPARLARRMVPRPSSPLHKRRAARCWLGFLAHEALPAWVTAACLTHTEWLLFLVGLVGTETGGERLLVAAPAFGWQSAGIPLARDDHHVGLRSSAAAMMACTMATYPVHRHRLPARPARTSYWVGLGFCCSSARAAMIIPGVQNPHCRAPYSTKRRW